MTVRRLILPPVPPNATLADMRQWAAHVKSLTENYARLQSAPAGQQMLATAFTTSTICTGTTTGTDLANVVSSLIATLTSKGILSPSITREQG
jgi:hypothetical protein